MPTRLTSVTGTATAVKVPRNFPSKVPTRLAGRERRRSKVPWTRSLLIASKVTTTAKIGMTNVAKPAAMIRRTKSGPTVKKGEGGGLEVKNARVWFSPATWIVTLDGPKGSSRRPYPCESTSLTYVSLR